MRTEFFKRSMSALLAVIMVVTMLPVQAFAEETDTHVHSEETEFVLETEGAPQSEEETIQNTVPDQTTEAVDPAEQTTAATESVDPTESTEQTQPVEEAKSLHQQLQELADGMLLKYLGTTDATEKQIRAVVYQMPDAELSSCRAEIETMIPLLGQLTEEQLQTFAAENAVFAAFADSVMEERTSKAGSRATSGTVLNGQITVTDTASNVSVSGSTVTVTVKGSGGLTAGKTSTNTVTVTNTCGSMAQISFDYDCTATGTYTFSESTPGSFSGMLEPNGTVTFTMTATGGAIFSSSTATLKLTNFKLTIPKESSNVTVGFDSSRGSVTAAGTAISSGTTLEGITPTTGVALAATPASGCSFVCWINGTDNSIVSYDASFTLQPEDDLSLKAVFARSSSDAYFSINKILYNSLNDAVNAAKSGDVVTLVGNGTLPAGDYSIPSGITLLIPFDESGAVYTTEPASDSGTTTPSAYGTLTLAKGANLTVNGTMSVTAKHYRNGGRPVGKYGHVALNEGSSIKVNGKLYAYGYITGKGSVKIVSGASVYEYFQIIDFRGGSNTLEMNGNSNDVFPLSQYYIQNVEAPMTLEAGATEYGYTTLYMSSTEFHSTVKFIGTSGAMFNLTSGSVTKQYDGTTDRLIIKADGTMSLEPISLSISVYTLNSGDYVLPINSSITIELESGTATIKQDLALQPEAQVIIHPGATCKLASGIRMYVYDNDQWGNFVHGGIRLKAVPYAASRTYKSATSSSRTVAKDAMIQVAGTLDASAGKLYTTESGAAITGVEGGSVKMGSVSSGSTYQANNDVSYTTIAVTSAKLQNTDGTYTSTSANTYSYEDGIWQISCDHSYSLTGTVNATCTAEGSKTYTCSKCGRSYSESIPATGHTAGKTVTENVKEATCTADGSYDSVVYCSKCNGEMSRQTVTVTATGHSWDQGVTTTAPTCTAAGVKKITCGACGSSYTEAIAALGHNMVYTATKDPTCTEDGQSASAYCSRCDYVEESGGAIPALGHDWKETSRKDATCTEAGSVSYRCSRCGNTKAEPIAALEHQYSAVVTEPTCDAQGYTTHTCGRCGHSYKDTYVESKGHAYSSAVTEPTCETAGYTTYTCSVCGHSYEGNPVAALGHDYGDGSVTKIPTCTEPGNRTFTCALCGDSYDSQIDALGHDLTQHAAKLASYTSVGWDAYEECAVCEYTTYKEYPILSRKGVSDYDTFLEDLRILEQIADNYVEENPTEDPMVLVLNYIRNGVAGYTDTSWAIMAGSENTDFTAYVLAYEDAYNTLVTDPEDLISVVSIRDLEHFAAPNDPSFKLEFSHMFGTMDITGYNPGSVNHADVAGWSGDLVDLMDLLDGKSNVMSKNTVEEMVDAIFANDYIAGSVEALGRQDMYGDLDAYYIMQELEKRDYYAGLMTEIIRGYFVQGLTDEDRAAYFLENRLDGITNREQLRGAVYREYTGNKLNTTLEATRTFVSGSDKLYDLRLACCYAFADYLWRLAGDYVEDSGNGDLTVSSSESVTLAPGIIRQTVSATNGAGEKLNYYVTAADLNQDTVRVDSAVGRGTVLALAQSQNTNALAAINAGAISAADSYETGADLAAALTGTALVRGGKSVATAGNTRTAATAAGVTKTGKAVFVTVDNATHQELAGILLDAGCESAVLLDSGNKTSFVSRTETQSAWTNHMNSTAEVTSVLLMISDAPDDTAFDHAILDADYTYLTANAAVSIRAAGVTARGSEVEIPDGKLTWSVSNSAVGSVNTAGKFTAAAIGETEVTLSLDGKKIGSITMHVVLPDTLYFTQDNINAYFGEATALPLAAKYNRKNVAIAAKDVSFTVSDNDDGVSGGSVIGFNFTGNEASGLKTIRITAALAGNTNVRDTLSVTMYNKGDVVFDFNNVTGGNRQLAWLRQVSNSTTENNSTYYVVDTKKPMVVDYTLAIDMSAIPVPEQLKELTEMLPGADSTDGTAWGFLLQLADRISALTQVEAQIQLDPNFDVDLSGLSLQNEYFTLSAMELDEQTNVLTVTLNWVKQTGAIEPATANPVCVVSGIKLTPRDNAAWVDNSMTPVNSGELSYRFYLSAGALYTFANDPANQAQYGLAPYINPNNSSDRGASFGADYASFQDTFTLINALKNGWYFEEGKNVFYVDGVLHTEHTAKESTTTKPTCTEGGYTSNVCAVCEIVYITNETEALGHTEVTDKAVAPTCTATGLTEGKHCSVCNAVLTAQTVVPAKGHTEVIDKAVDPTCTESGLTEGKHCSVCNTVLTAQTEVPAKGHTEVIDKAVPPTCTETGLTEGKHCSVCGVVLVEQNTVPAGNHTDANNDYICDTCGEDLCTDHEVTTVPAKAPTCTAEGLTEGKRCAKCGEVIVAQETIPALGHTEVTDKGVAATCTETGLTEGKHCSVCNTVLTAQTVIPAKGHTEVIDKAVAATCTESGLTEGKHCSVCNTVLTAQTVIPAKGHTEVIDKAVAPTCTATGLTEGKHCSVCNTVLTAQTVVPAKGHTEVVDQAVAPTCTTTGLTEGKHCSVCGTVLTAQTVISAKGHTEVIDKAVAATCTETGLTEGKHCSVCGTVLVAQKVVAAKDHTVVIDKAVDATCTATGLTEGKHCAVCNTVLTAQTVVPAKGHTEVTDKAVAPTCTATGLTEGKHCSVCNTVLTAQTEVPAKGHTAVVDQAVAPTCTATGLTEGKHCSVCNTVLTAQTVVPAKGHTEVIDKAVAATCTATGLTEGKHCSVCGAVLTAQTVVPAKGHTEVIDKAVAATCTETGLTEGKHCSVCNTVLTAQQTVQALGHKDTNKDYICDVCGEDLCTDHEEQTVPAKAPTCTETGLTEGKRCAKCGEVIEAQRVIPAKGHTEVTDKAVEPTCTATGLTEGKHCSVCNEVLTAQTRIPAKGHTEVVDAAVAPNCTESGLTEGKHCSVCQAVLVAQQTLQALGHTAGAEADCITAQICSVCKVVLVPALGHDMVDQAEVPATCTQPGSRAGRKCSRCDYSEGGELIPAPGHIEVFDAAVAPTCAESGWTAGSHCSACGEVLVAQEEIPAHGHDFKVKDGDFVCSYCSFEMYLALQQEHIFLYMNQPYQIPVDISPADLADDIRWTVEEGGEQVLFIDAYGNVSTLGVGTAYVVITVTDGDITLTERCRVDVAKAIELDGIQLSAEKLTSELYSTDYAVLDVLMQLPQNYPVDTLSVSSDAAMAAVGSGIAIENAYFADETMAALFDLVVLDDRRVQVVPTDYAVENAKEMKSKYTGSIFVTVQGEVYESEALTLTVKKSTPKLKATVASFNSFYSGDTQEILITGGTPTKITAINIPDWLTLQDALLTLNENAPLKSTSAKLSLLVETEEWNTPAELSVTVKNSYKTPGLKLSESSVKLSEDARNSNGVELTLKAKSSKDTLKGLNVTGITAPAGYTVENFSQEDGTFTLKAAEGFQAGKIDLNVTFSDTRVTLPLALTVKTAEVTLKASVKSVTLNTALNDTAQIDLTATPADYRITAPSFRLTDSKGADKTGELAVRFGNGSISISNTAATPTGASYKLYVSAGGSKEIAITIKNVSDDPSVTFKAKSKYDLTFPEQAAEILPTFKNYNGRFTVIGMTAENSKKADATAQFSAAVDGKSILVTAKENTEIGTYTLNLKLALANGTVCENSVKVSVKRTSVKLKLSESKLTLNKAIGETGSVDVTCSTEGYDFIAPIVELMDKSGKASAAGRLNITYAEGKLNVAVNGDTQYGATYKVLVKANAAASAATLTVTIPTEAKSIITASVKTSGSLDVIRDGKSVTVTPSYKNIKNLTGMEETMVFYSSADDYTKEVNSLFRYEPNGKGGYTVTRAEGAKLDHSLKYKVQLVSRIGTAEVRSSLVSIGVSMGSAKLTVNESSVDLFAKDKNDRGLFHLTAKDAALNAVKSVKIKDSKYENLFEIYTYGNGEFAIGFKDGKVDSSLVTKKVSKTVTVTLNVWMEGNQTEKVNTTVKLKVNVIK